MTDISTNVVLVCYSYDSLIPNNKKDNDKTTVRIKEINNFHYLTFNRSFKFGGAMTFDTFGVVKNINPGDWVVTLYSSKGKIRGKFNLDEIKAEKPQPIFIGQVFSKTIQDFADADGNKRAITQVVVREWTHAFTMPFRLDELNLIVSSKPSVSAIAEQTKISVNEILASLANTAFDPFEYAEFTLNAISAFAGEASINTIKTLNDRPNVNQRMPIIPIELYEDWIIKETSNQIDEIKNFNPKSPWATGFYSTAFGVWGEYSLRAPDLSKIQWGKGSIKDTLKLSNGNRPSALKSLFNKNNNMFGSGSIVELITENFGEFEAAYEFYGDLLYDTDSGKVKPTLFLRDKPMSFEKIWSLRSDYELGFKWTYIDKIPRATIESVNVVNMISTFNFQGAYNFTRVNLSTSTWKNFMAHGAATSAGVQYNLPAQDRFGSMALEITSMVYPQDISENVKADNVVAIGQSWVQALGLKFINYYAYSFLFPEVVVSIKNASYPLTVGMAVRIPQHRGGLTIVGLIKDIRFDVKTEEGSLINSSTIITLSDVGYEEVEFGRILPLPKSARNSLQFPKSRIPQSEIDDILNDYLWTNGKGTFDEGAAEISLSTDRRV